MLLALRRRLRLPLPLGPGECGQSRHGCGRRLDAWSDHALACTRTGLLARRAKLVDRAWMVVCREAVGAEGHVVPQQWQACRRRTADDSTWSYMGRPRRALPCASLCCHATLVSPISTAGTPHPHAADTPGMALRTAEAIGSPQARHIPGTKARRKPAAVRPGRRGWRPVESGRARLGPATRARQGAARAARHRGNAS